jgi:predicted aminopeptidase
MDYYWQSAAGQFDLIARARPIDGLIAETDDASLKARLQRITQMRAFASKELGLPANGSYTRYTDLGRPFVTWTVFATPELSLAPKEWCFPIGGCVAYRGYFNQAEADEAAAHLASQGDDVYIGHVPAYSTLGYFDDPVLSSFMRWPETDVARLIFHELAHQLIYVPGDTLFNESYAVTVETAGLERWLAHEHQPALWEQFQRTERTRSEFNALVRRTRARLAVIYSSDRSQAEKRRLKAVAFAELRRAYDAGRQTDPGLAGYEAWFDHHLNNAKLASVAFYTDRVPAFRAILAEEGGNLQHFYGRVRQLARIPKSERDRVLDRYQTLGRSAAVLHVRDDAAPAHVGGA